MKRLVVRDMGDKVQGVELRGDRRNPEPESFRVVFPGGDVDVVRTTTDDYWVHVRVNVAGDLHAQEDLVVGQLVDARLDIQGRHASDVNVGDFADPGLYHLAVRVARAAVAAPTKEAAEPKRRAGQKALFDGDAA